MAKQTGKQTRAYKLILSAVSSQVPFQNHNLTETTYNHQKQLLPVEENLYFDQFY